MTRRRIVAPLDARLRRLGHRLRCGGYPAAAALLDEAAHALAVAWWVDGLLRAEVARLRDAIGRVDPGHPDAAWRPAPDPFEAPMPPDRPHAIRPAAPSGPGPRDFRADYARMRGGRAAPIIPAVVGRLIGNLLDEVDRLRAARDAGPGQPPGS